MKIIVYFLVICLISFGLCGCGALNDLNADKTSVEATKNQTQSFVITQKEKQEKYKAEIEKAIDEEIPKAKSEIDKEVINTKELYDKIVINKLGRDSQEHSDITLTQEIVVPFTLAKVYSKLIKITSNYAEIETGFATDNYGPLEDELEPYLENNNIDLSKIDELKAYIQKANAQIQIYIDKVEQNFID